MMKTMALLALALSTMLRVEASLIKEDVEEFWDYQGGIQEFEQCMEEEAQSCDEQEALSETALAKQRKAASQLDDANENFGLAKTAESASKEALEKAKKAFRIFNRKRAAEKSSYADSRANVDLSMQTVAKAEQAFQDAIGSYKDALQVSEQCKADVIEKCTQKKLNNEKNYKDNLDTFNQYTKNRKCTSLKSEYKQAYDEFKRAGCNTEKEGIVEASLIKEDAPVAGFWDYKGGIKEFEDCMDEEAQTCDDQETLSETALDKQRKAANRLNDANENFGLAKSAESASKSALEKAKKEWRIFNRDRAAEKSRYADSSANVERSMQTVAEAEQAFKDAIEAHTDALQVSEQCKADVIEKCTQKKLNNEKKYEDNLDMFNRFTRDNKCTSLKEAYESVKNKLEEAGCFV